MEIKNRKAYFQFYILDKFEAGIQFIQKDIKLFKTGSLNISNAYCFFENNQLYIFNLTGQLKSTKRKLLMHRKQMLKIFQISKQKNLSIIPIQMYQNNHHKVKLEIGLAKPKKLFDKRENIKIKEINRNLNKIK